MIYFNCFSCIYFTNQTIDIISVKLRKKIYCFSNLLFTFRLPALHRKERNKKKNKHVNALPSLQLACFNFKSLTQTTSVVLISLGLA